MPYRYAVPLLLLPAPLLAQTTPPDTTRAVTLPEATVTGYGQQLPLRHTAAAVGTLAARDFERFPQNALTQAVNTLPGVRLEERASGSYRLSVRGSTLRSPFGVRNTKVYYQGIPFTEASGSTPLNLLDPALLGGLEVVKGPAASVYGAGTGGAVLLSGRRPAPGTSAAQVGFTAGSYGLRRYVASVETGSATGYLRATYARQSLDGYRQQSALRRDVLALDGEWQLTEKQNVGLHALYSDINYQLPGGLTRAQFLTDPRQARPGTATAPGTVQQRTYYASRTALLGATHEARLTDLLSLRTTLYLSGSRINTPYLIDFERNTLLGGGGRTVANYRTALAGRTLRLQAGAEAQTGFESSRNYQNRAGQPGALRYDDEIRTLTGFAFAQADYELPAGLLLTAGASYNRLRYRISRLSDAATNPTGSTLERNFRPEVSPRVAVLREFGPALAVYGSVSTGFSPPTEEEIRPSDGSINRALQAERGTSYEVGARGTLLRQRLRYDVALYDQRQRQTITTRTTDLGTQLFANAGNTRQRGVEVALSGWLWRGGATSLQPQAVSAENDVSPTGLRAFVSYAYNHYRFGSYESGGQDFSGNRLTGTAPHTLTAGLDLVAPLGFYLSPTVNHQARIYLNDANTEAAPGYWTFGSRGGWRRSFGGFTVDVFGGAENLTDRRYSLGNDLNAFGGRYFQPAPARNWYAGVSLRQGKEKK
ncbi:TonB-dependent receptor family protein [Hymenobacter endophyticus]|uniref:TonB-dependent receptor plug domain-containing protein n=1 Tax=Hymenobacter endophyticus TaxID=3076335 RepID=A0ABU3TJ70_9BACT|nr:TonB-dependent receptor [Hymenobacter endophyticus]MDU0371411.1 TonB-dependent receptor plug domain-containing protein [Hymenobacter endophyticus]